MGMIMKSVVIIINVKIVLIHLGALSEKYLNVAILFTIGLSYRK